MLWNSVCMCVCVNMYTSLYVVFVFSEYPVFLWNLSFVGLQAQIKATNINDPVSTQCPDSA